MVMGQDRSTDDRQVRVGAQEIMRELAHEIEQLAEGRMVDRHRRMLEVERYAVFIVIAVRAVLKTPFRIVDRDRNDAVILAGRVRQSSGIPLVLRAEEAFRIVRRLCLSGRSDRLGVLLRLGEIDRDINVTVLGGHLPAKVLLGPVAADIIRVLAELVEPVCRLLRRLLI